MISVPSFFVGRPVRFPWRPISPSSAWLLLAKLLEEGCGPARRSSFSARIETSNGLAIWKPSSYYQNTCCTIQHENNIKILKILDVYIFTPFSLFFQAPECFYNKLPSFFKHPRSSKVNPVTFFARVSSYIKRRTCEKGHRIHFE